MKKLILKKTFWAALLAVGLVSCVNEEYDLNDVNTEITVGGEALTLPLGSTEQLKLKDLLKSLDTDILESKDGAYSVSISDEMDLSENMPDLSKDLKIDDISFNNDFEFVIGDFDPKSLTINAQTIDSEFKLIEDDINTEVEIPALKENLSEKTGIYEYAGEVNKIKFNLDNIGFKTGELFKVPSQVAAIPGPDSQEIDLSSLLAKATVPSQSESISVKTTLPEKISKVGDIKMTESSKLVVSLSMKNCFLKKGTIDPQLKLDVSSLLGIKGVTGSIDLSEHFTLNETNNYSATATFNIKDINIQPTDWSESGELNLNKSFSLSGDIELKSPVTTIGLIKDNVGAMSLDVAVSFKDIAVESVTMEIQEIEVTHTSATEIKIEDIKLPELITELGDVVFEEGSSIDISFNSKNLDFPGLNLNLDELTLEFPKNIKLRGTADNKVSFAAQSLTSKITKSIEIESISLPDPVSGVISFQDEVKVTAKMVAGGRINSADLPKTEDKDGEVNISVTSDLKVKDYSFMLSEISEQLETEPEVFSYEIPEEISNFGALTIELEGSPAIELAIDLPTENLQVAPGKDGIKIQLPDFIVFENVSSSLDFDYTKNVLTLKDEFPTAIKLPVKQVKLIPVKNETTGKYSVESAISIGGSIAVPAQEISKEDVDKISKATAKIKASIPTLKAKNVALDRFSFDLNEEFDVKILAADDFPKELLSLETIDLSAIANLNALIKGLPKGLNNVNIDAKVELPSIIVLDQAEKHTITIKGAIKDGKINCPAINVKSIDLSKFDFGSGKDLTGKIKLSGEISAEKPQIDIEELADAKISTTIDAGIKDINIKKVVGKVDYKIDGINETISIEGLPDFLKAEGTVLDFYNPHISLELTTNLGIPTKGVVDITPIFAGTADEESKIELNLTLPYSTSGKESVTGKFWIASEEIGVPDGYTFIKGDIRKLLKRIPDGLTLALNATTVTTESATIEPQEKYNLSIAYGFGLPLSFGENMSIAISDTLENLGIGQFLDFADVKLLGEISNTLPLELDLNVELMDANYNIIQTKSKISQKIAACPKDKDVVKSPITLEIIRKEGVDITKAEALKLTFKVSSAGISGVAIEEEDYIQASLKLNIPGGITVDLGN
jgi:hypothetical protein